MTENILASFKRVSSIYFSLLQWKISASNSEDYLFTTVALTGGGMSLFIHWSQIGGAERKGRCQVAQFTDTSNVRSMQQKSNASAQFTTKSTLQFTTWTVLHQPEAHQSQLCCPNKTKSIAPAQFTISHKFGAERKVPSNIIHHQHNMLACQNR